MCGVGSEGVSEKNVPMVLGRPRGQMWVGSGGGRGEGRGGRGGRHGTCTLLFPLSTTAKFPLKSKVNPQGSLN